MTSATQSLRLKFAELLAWERAKRREQTLISTLFYALCAALLILPLPMLLGMAFSRWWIPLLLVFVTAPILLFKSRWRGPDSVRAVARADAALRLEARAITAWEILARGENNAAEALVIRQAEERLTSLNPKTLFKRQPSWHGYLVAPLFGLWLLLLWFNVGVPVGHEVRPRQTLAHKLREFSRELQDKAQVEGLRQSLQVGRELEKLAQQGIETKAGDDRIKSELAGVAKKIDALGKAGVDRRSFSAAEGQQSLRDLKAELQAARELFNTADAAKGSEQLTQQWLDQLSTLPQLKRQLDDQAAQKLSQSELKSLLDRIDQQATSELDRRTLLEAQQFLDQLMNPGQQEKGESNVRVAGGEKDGSGDGEKTRSRSSLPGNEPGKRDDLLQPPPAFQSGAATHLKGLLGDGPSSGLMFKGNASDGKSEVSQEEVLAKYRRQAESELNTERVPEALKETIKNYFLSLGVGEEKR